MGDTLLVGQILAALTLPVKLHVARDGMQALLMLAGHTFEPDLLILDLNLPGISGLEVLRRFHPREIPIVVFSSSIEPHERAEALALGAKEYVQKPSDLDAYTGAVRGIIERWCGGGCDKGATA